MSKRPIRNVGWGRASWVIALALMVGLTLVHAASASYDPVGSGTTTITLDKGFLALLRHDAIRLTATAPARLRGNQITLPVFAGSVDPTLGKGTVEQQGAIVFSSTRNKVPLKDIVYKTKHSPLTAKVGGSQLKLTTTSKLGSTRQGFGTGFSAKGLKLTAKLITRLNKKLRPAKPFTTGQLLGTLSTKTTPATLAVLPTGRATLVLDPAMVAKLNSLFVSVNPIFPAEHQGSTFTVPFLPGGTIAPDGLSGSLHTDGAIELLQLGAGQLFWHEFWFELTSGLASPEVDVEPAPPYAGKLGRIPIGLLSGATVASDPAARTVTVNGASLVLGADTAATFNQVFAQPQGKSDVFHAGEALGTLSYTAQTQ